MTRRIICVSSLLHAWVFHAPKAPGGGGVWQTPPLGQIKHPPTNQKRIPLETTSLCSNSTPNDAALRFLID